MKRCLDEEVLKKSVLLKGTASAVPKVFVRNAALAAGVRFSLARHFFSILFSPGPSLHRPQSSFFTTLFSPEDFHQTDSNTSLANPLHIRPAIELRVVIQVVLDHAIALACLLLKPRNVHDVDHSPAILDQPVFFQHSSYR